MSWNWILAKKKWCDQEMSRPVPEICEEPSWVGAKKLKRLKKSKRFEEVEEVGEVEDVRRSPRGLKKLKKLEKLKMSEEVEEAVVVERTTKTIIFIVGNGRIRQSVQVHFHYYFPSSSDHSTICFCQT